jgi:hypothetical protein
LFSKNLNNFFQGRGSKNREVGTKLQIFVLLLQGTRTALLDEDMRNEDACNFYQKQQCGAPMNQLLFLKCLVTQTPGAIVLT